MIFKAFRSAKTASILSKMLAPFLGMVGGTSILRGLRAGAKQVGESPKCCGVGVFHAANFFGRV